MHATYISTEKRIWDVVASGLHTFMYPNIYQVGLQTKQVSKFRISTGKSLMASEMSFSIFPPKKWNKKEYYQGGVA